MRDGVIKPIRIEKPEMEFKALTAENPVQSLGYGFLRNAHEIT
jgi:hypothetical protein